MPDAETARALLSGLIAGTAAAFATTAIALVALVHDERWRGVAPSGLPGGGRVPLPLLGVVFVNGLMLAWTALGLVLGAAYLRAEATHPAGGLGSPNRLFTLLVVGAVVLLLFATGYVRGRLTRPMWSTALVAVLAFGWLLPGLAR